MLINCKFAKTQNKYIMRIQTFIFRVILLTSLFIIKFSYGQEKQYKVACIAFYNIENLYDTIDDPNKDDKEFLPDATNNWNTMKYRAKLDNLSGVIAQLGDELTKDGPVIVGLSEIENRKVVEDLINTDALKKFNYGVVHYDSPDKRGVDVGLIYQKNNFTVINSKSHRLNIPGRNDFFTRDILEVCGLLDGDKIFILVNHWPSRSSGEVKTMPLRAAAADLCRTVVDSILKSDPHAKIVIMGDLNDDPTDASIVKHLKAKGNAAKLKPGELYNPMMKLFDNGIGSLAYRDSWNLFDQFIISHGLFAPEGEKGFKFLKTRVFNKKFLTQSEGQYAGYPFRTFAGGVYAGGYSDHFPVYLFLAKEVK